MLGVCTATRPTDESGGDRVHACAAAAADIDDAEIDDEAW
jgi:hypothetical protein